MAAKLLDPFLDADTVIKQPSRGFRQVRRPVFCLVVDPTDLSQTAQALATVIRARLYRCECPAFLFIDADMHAYVIPENRPTAQRWVTEHFGWLVGVYAFVHRNGAPMLRPTTAGIAEDLNEHMADMARTR